MAEDLTNGYRSLSYWLDALPGDLGINAGLNAMRLADPEERLTGRPSVIARAFSRLMSG